MSRNEPEATGQQAPPSEAPERPAAPRPPVPAPPRADAALSAIHEELTAVLHKAEG